MIFQPEHRGHTAHQRPGALVLCGGAIEAQRHEQVVQVSAALFPPIVEGGSTRSCAKSACAR
jgi:hypothetical protein